MTRLTFYCSLVTALLISCLLAPQTIGKIQAMRNGLSQSVSTGYWASTINSTNGPSSNTPYVLTWTGSIRKQYALIALINTGTFDLTSSAISFSSVKTNGNSTTPPTLTYDLCSGNWDSTNYSCSGSITTVFTATSGVANFSEPILAGNRIIIRVTNLRDSNANYQTTFDALTSRTNIRTGVVTSS